LLFGCLSCRENPLQARPIDLDTPQADINDKWDEGHFQLSDPDKVDAVDPVAMFVRWICQLGLKRFLQPVKVEDILAAVFKLFVDQECTTPIACGKVFWNHQPQMPRENRA
jgi:hypothetical protein